MLYGKILRPHAHARICSIDTRHADKLPASMPSSPPRIWQALRALVDLAEGVLHNMRFLSNNIMAADKCSIRDTPSQQAATSPHIAEEALSPSIESMKYSRPYLRRNRPCKEGAPLLHERLAAVSNANLRPGGFLNDDDPTPGTNLANRFEFRSGMWRGFGRPMSSSMRNLHGGCAPGVYRTAHGHRAGTVMAR